MVSSVGVGRKRKRCNNISREEQDMISALTDDILLHILSSLEIKEAARTSVLSKRWRFIWANLHDLDIDGSEIIIKQMRAHGLYTNELRKKIHYNEACKFVDLVDQVLTSHRAPFIHKFRLHFPLVPTCREDIKRWVDFMLGKGVKQLELNLSNYYGLKSIYPMYLSSFRCYDLDLPVNTLVSLTLVAVNIIGECFIESILVNFPNLEHLTLMQLEFLGTKNLKFKGFLKLKYLKISCCKGIEKLEICAQNLISTFIFGSEMEVKYCDVPLLKWASFAGTYSTYLLRNFNHISSFSAQLEKLTIDLYKIPHILYDQINFPNFSNIKQLVLAVMVLPHQSLLVLTKFIGACPLLHKFRLERTKSYPETILERNVSKDPSNCGQNHRKLKVVEFVGFFGSARDVELILFLVDYALMLSKLIIDPRNPFRIGTPELEWTPMHEIQAARKQAQLLLLPQLTPTVDVVVI